MPFQGGDFGAMTGFGPVRRKLEVFWIEIQKNLMDD
jgi:hypothetical protein